MKNQWLQKGFTLFFVLPSLLLGGEGGDGVGNHGGLVEPMILSTWTRMKVYFDRTLKKAKTLKLDSDQIDLLEKLLNRTKKDKRHPLEALRFNSDSKAFLKRARNRNFPLAYVDKKEEGMPIYLNTSLFYKQIEKKKATKLKPLAIGSIPIWEPEKDKVTIDNVSIKEMVTEFTVQMAIQENKAPEKWVDELAKKVATEAVTLEAENAEKIKALLDSTNKKRKKIDLTQLKPRKSFSISGTLFPHSEDPSEEVLLYFLPKGKTRLYRIFANFEKEAGSKELTRGFESLIQHYVPIQSRIEVSALGTLSGAALKKASLEKADTLVIKNFSRLIAPNKTLSLSQSVSGTLSLSSRGTVLIHNKTLGRVPVDFVDSKLKSHLVKLIKENGELQGTLFTNSLSKQRPLRINAVTFVIDDLEETKN